MGLELVEQCPDLAAVYVVVGGGGLIGGIGSYLKEVCPNVAAISGWTPSSLLWGYNEKRYIQDEEAADAESPLS